MSIRTLLAAPVMALLAAMACAPGPWDECGLDRSQLRRLAGAELRAELRRYASPTATLTTARARDALFAQVDVADGWVETLYTGYRFRMNPGDPTQSALAAGVNTEHVWPRSMGASREPAEADLHILAPVREEVNSARGNRPFAELDESADLMWYGDSGKVDRPASGHPRYSKLGDAGFEPRARSKGNVARAMLYFATVYEAQVAGSPVFSEFFALQRPTLLVWNEADPPDPDEVSRSIRARQVQGNCNPFVLDRTLAARAWADQQP